MKLLKGLLCLTILALPYLIAQEADQEEQVEEVNTTAEIEVESPSAEGMGHSIDMPMGMEMHHDPVEASQEMNVKLNVYKDIFNGYSIQLIVNGLTFTPENAGKQHVDGEGHAHIYIDGEKIARVYGTSFHLGNILSEGEHEIKISLNSNDHSPYTYNGESVEDTVTVEVGLHGTINADEEMSVELSAYEDTLGGYNIHIQPTGFAFSAANPGALHINGKGYAQIFVNGKVIARSYTPWYNLSGSLFREGENEIRVKLLSNNHNYYTYRTKSVSATLLVNVADAEEDQMSMEDHDMESMDDMSTEESSEEESEVEVEAETEEDTESDEATEVESEVEVEDEPEEEDETETEEASEEDSEVEAEVEAETEENAESDEALEDESQEESESTEAETEENSEVEVEAEAEEANPEEDAESPEQDSEADDSSDDESEEDIDQKDEP